MTFEEAGRQYAMLRQQRDLGQISDAQYRQAVNQLMVLDSHGTYWLLNADSAQWMTYNGVAWVPQGPAAQKQPLAYTQSSSPAAAVPVPKTSWWQRLWDLITVLGSVVMAASWYWYSGLADTKPDIKTCVAMLVLPILLILFRKQLDNMLRPLAKFRCKVPPMVLFGIGLAVPFLVSSYLYSQGVSQFPFMFRSYVYSTVLSYIILRTPSPLHTISQPGISLKKGDI